MNRLLVIDIETAPATNPEVIEAIRESITVPGNYKKPESIAEWYRTQGVEVMQERVAGTALKGMQGELIAVGYNRVDFVHDGNGGQEIVAEQRAIHVREPNESPKDFLRKILWLDVANLSAPQVTAGHNLVQFDLPFLWQQCVRHNIPWVPWLPVLPSAFSPDVLDTMTGLVGHRNTISLKDAAAACGIPYDPDAGASSAVPTAWQDGNLDFVRRHLENDITVTTALAARIINVRKGQ
jgi:hypothetical protein